MKPEEREQRRWELKAAVGFVAICDALIAFVGDHHAMLGPLVLWQRVALFGFLMLGPFGAWPFMRAESFVGSLPLLVPVHLFAIVPLALYAKTRNIGFLAWGSLAWVATAYLVSIAVWI